jgi:recombination protein RecA
MDPRVNEIAARLGPEIRVRVGPGPAAARRARRTGIPGLDRLLPGGGYPVGGVVEILGTLDGGRGHLALRAAAQQSREGRVLLAAAEGAPDPWHFRRVGGDLRNLSLVRMGRPDRYVWAVEQILRSGLFRLVVAQGTGPRSGRVLFDPPAWRRWSAAASQGDVTFLLLLEDIPELAAFARPSLLRLRVRRETDGRLGVRVERIAGQAPGASLSVGEGEA